VYPKPYPQSQAQPFPGGRGGGRRGGRAAWGSHLWPPLCSPSPLGDEFPHQEGDSGARMTRGDHEPGGIPSSVGVDMAHIDIISICIDIADSD
jgi:hypothetical protein